MKKNWIVLFFSISLNICFGQNVSKPDTAKTNVFMDWEDSINTYAINHFSAIDPYRTHFDSYFEALDDTIKVMHTTIIRMHLEGITEFDSLYIFDYYNVKFDPISLGILRTEFLGSKIIHTNLRMYGLGFKKISRIKLKNNKESIAYIEAEYAKYIKDAEGVFLAGNILSKFYKNKTFSFKFY